MPQPHPVKEGGLRLPLQPEPWRAEAACRYSDNPDLWFSADAEDRDAARLICFTCPVRQPCHDYAVAMKQRVAIWGGRGVRRLVLMH